MRTVDINNISIKFLIWKNDLPQGDYLCYLTQPSITRHRPF